MKPYELLELKKIYLSQIKITRKTTLNKSQKAIIFLISFFMLCFFTYKIGYYIYIIKENNANLLKIIQYTFIGDNENITIYDNITINNTDNNHTIKITEDLLIPTSYSGHLEDLILNIFFYDINKGFYIDIGNFSPNKTSVTKYFYLKGWNGINIKPQGNEFDELERIRVKDINLNYYMGGKFKNKYCFQCLGETNDTIKKISEILSEYIPKNKEIHFCKIDLREDSRKILLEYDFNIFRPKIFCIESYNTSKSIPDHERFEYILNNNKYSFIYQYENVRYYIDDNVNNLKISPNLINEIIKEYKSKKNK